MVKRFGEEYNEECDRIRAQLVKEGWDAKDPFILFEISKRYQEAHKNDLTYRERQELRKKNRKPSVKLNTVRFTDDELNYLRERMAFSNDPVGQAIYAKLGGSDV